MYRVEMFIDGEWYPYGTYEDRKKANEVGILVREERGCWIKVIDLSKED